MRRIMLAIEFFYQNLAGRSVIFFEIGRMAVPVQKKSTPELTDTGKNLPFIFIVGLEIVESLKPYREK